MITVKQLREILADMPDDTPIVMQKDDEGNGYRYMNGIDFEPADSEDANFYDDSDYEGECIRKSDVEYLMNEYGDEDQTEEEYLAKYKLVAVAY